MSNKTKVQIGPATLAWTVVAGQGLQNYNKDGFNYAATAIVDGGLAQTIATQLKELLAEVNPKGDLQMDSVPFRLLTAEKNDKGELAYKLDKLAEPSFDNLKADEKYGFRLQQSTINVFTKQKQVIKLYDAKGVEFELSDGQGIGNGSTGIVYGTAVGWGRGRKCGVSLYLDGVQIIDIVEFNTTKHDVKQTDGSFSVGEDPKNITYD